MAVVRPSISTLGSRNGLRSERVHRGGVGSRAPTSLEGTALEERNVRHVFTRILVKAELRQVRIHDLRHTFAPLLQQGESIVYVKEQLGHASIQITGATKCNPRASGKRFQPISVNAVSCLE